MIQAEKADNNFQKLYELLLREQLIFTAPSELQIWLRERNPGLFNELTQMAGTYQLAHRRYAQVQYENSKQVSFESVGQDTKYTSKKQLYGNMLSISETTQLSNLNTHCTAMLNLYKLLFCSLSCGDENIFPKILL